MWHVSKTGSCYFFVTIISIRLYCSFFFFFMRVNATPLDSVMNASPLLFIPFYPYKHVSDFSNMFSLLMGYVEFENFYSTHP